MGSLSPSAPPPPPLERADARITRAPIEAFARDLREVDRAPFDALEALRRLTQSLPLRLREGVEVTEDEGAVTSARSGRCRRATRRA